MISYLFTDPDVAAMQFTVAASPPTEISLVPVAGNDVRLGIYGAGRIFTPQEFQDADNVLIQEATLILPYCFHTGLNPSHVQLQMIEASGADLTFRQNIIFDDRKTTEPDIYIKRSDGSAGPGNWTFRIFSADISISMVGVPADLVGSVQSAMFMFKMKHTLALV